MSTVNGVNLYGSLEDFKARAKSPIAVEKLFIACIMAI